jgi:hypothetical protein
VKRLGAALAVVLCLGVGVAAPSADAVGNGVIVGTVTSADNGKPLAALEVCALYLGQSPFECTVTYPDGTYTISVPAGEYLVKFGRLESDYEPKLYGYPAAKFGAIVKVPEGGASTPIDASLYATRGWIEGAVTSPDGAPIEGALVCAESVTGTEIGETELACGRSQGGGRYRLGRLEASFYRVRFGPPEGGNFLSTYFGGGASADSATSLWVAADHPETGIDAVLQPGATISGNVSDAAGGGALRGVSVCAWSAAEYQCGETDGNGNYAIPRLTAGGYKVEFAPPRFTDYARQYWNDKFSFEAAETVMVGTGASASGIDAKLTKESQPSPPAPAPTPGTAAVRPKAAVKGAKAALTVSCGGTGACAGTIKLATRVVTTRNGKNGKPTKRAHVVAIGHARFSIPAAATRTVSVTLNGAGKLLVQEAGAKGVRATVAGPGVRPGPVKLVSAAPRRPR